VKELTKNDPHFPGAERLHSISYRRGIRCGRPVWSSGFSLPRASAAWRLNSEPAPAMTGSPCTSVSSVSPWWKTERRSAAGS